MREEEKKLMPNKTSFNARRYIVRAVMSAAYTRLCLQISALLSRVKSSSELSEARKYEYLCVHISNRVENATVQVCSIWYVCRLVTTRDRLRFFLEEVEKKRNAATREF